MDEDVNVVLKQPWNALGCIAVIALVQEGAAPSSSLTLLFWWIGLIGVD